MTVEYCRLPGETWYQVIECRAVGFLTPDKEIYKLYANLCTPVATAHLCNHLEDNMKDFSTPEITGENSIQRTHPDLFCH